MKASEEAMRLEAGDPYRDFLRKGERQQREAYEEYKAATKDSRAYTSQAQASQSEKASAGARADGASTEGKTAKTSMAGAKK